MAYLTYTNVKSYWYMLYLRQKYAELKAPESLSFRPIVAAQYVKLIG